MPLRGGLSRRAIIGDEPRPRGGAARSHPAGLVARDAKDFAAVLPATGSLLGLDASKKRIGLAGTDLDRRLVTPLATIDRPGAQDEAAALAPFVTQRLVVGLVLGWPLNMDGSEGAMAKAAEGLGRRLARELGLPLLLQDERLTTFAVSEAIAEGRLQRPRKGEKLDHYAAAVILEDALRAMDLR